MVEPRPQKWPSTQPSLPSNLQGGALRPQPIQKTPKPKHSVPTTYLLLSVTQSPKPTEEAPRNQGTRDLSWECPLC